MLCKKDEGQSGTFCAHLFLVITCYGETRNDHEMIDQMMYFSTLLGKGKRRSHLYTVYAAKNLEKDNFCD